MPWSAGRLFARRSVENKSRSLKAIRTRRGFRDDTLNTETNQKPNLFCITRRKSSAPTRASIVLRVRAGAARKS